MPTIPHVGRWPDGRGRDNGVVSEIASPPESPDQPEVAQRQLPRRGRVWVILLLLLGLVALGYGLVNIATQKPNKNICRRLPGITSEALLLLSTSTTNSSTQYLP